MGRRRKNLRKPAIAAAQLADDTRSGEKELDSESIGEIGSNATTKDKTAIDVYSRLAFPFARVRLPDEIDDGETIEINFRPRFVFLSNLCLVCFEASKVVCEFCRMVSYCSAGHRKQGWPAHEALCQVLTEICVKEDGMSLAKGLEPERYRIYRLKLIEMIEGGVGRPLELWEREIILYPRVCRSCHKFSEDLICCSECEVDFFCREHEASHEPWCREFQVLRRVLSMQYKWGQANPQVMTVNRPLPFTLPEDFDLLLAELYDSSTYYRSMDCHTYSGLSHLSTIPLTALYSLQKSCPAWQTARELVVHVAGAEFQFECARLRAWEMFFLHLLPNLRTLTLAFVGPELQLPRAPLHLLASVKTCSLCRSRSIKVRFHPGRLYHEYSGTKDFVRPDLVCLFNPGLYRQTAFNGMDTWPRTIEEFCRLRVPVAVTSYTEHEIPREIERIESICKIDVLLKPQRNPYASVKPDRNFVSDDTAPLIYKNYFLTIVRGRK